MKIKFLLIALLFAGYSCKKDDPNTLPQVITGTWGLFSISIQTTTKSAGQFHSIRRDTTLQLSFSANHNLHYIELGLKFENYDLVSTDTLYQCQTSYSINGNKLTIDNLIPKYKPFFTVKDYTFFVYKGNQDTTLSINYDETVGNIFKRYELDFDKKKN